MKHESMPTQRLEEKRVEERVGEREREEREREEGREKEHALAPPFICFPHLHPPPRACPMHIGLSQECCLFYLKSSLWSSNLPLTFLGF